jgi:predicted CXXCH cytochrome family protein
MKRILSLVLMMLLVGLFAYSQTQPLGPQQSFTWGFTSQGVKSKMVGGPHDFGPGGLAVPGRGQSNGTCDYCHRPHIKTDGVAAPLWARKLNTGTAFPMYSSITLDAATDTGSHVGGHIYPINETGNNYSAFCLSCHDGSAYLATAAWGDNGHPYNNGETDSAWDARFTGVTAGAGFTFADARGNTGDLNLTHTHPVNFDYDYVALKDAQIYPKANANYVFLDASGVGIGRLFGGRMQCESCHNPHFKVGIGLMSPTGDQGGALCVACHKK